MRISPNDSDIKGPTGIISLKHIFWTPSLTSFFTLKFSTYSIGYV
jgi:hypothetical protein